MNKMNTELLEEISVIIITALIYILDFVFQHLFISFLFIVAIVFVIHLFN